jgi:hypothetical protein
MSNVAKITSELANVIIAVRKGRQKYQTAACNITGSMMRKRIHNKGLNSDGGKIGKYSEDYAKKRRDGLKIGKETFSGLRTDTVDLEVSGDLRRSLITGRQGKNVVLGITGTLNRKKAEGQEENFGEIYLPTDEETAAAEKQVIKLIDQDIKNALR